MSSNLAPNVRIIQPIQELIEQELNIHSPTKLRVAAYARVSTEQDEQQSSYEAQVRYYTNYIMNHERWEFVEVFADEGITGTNTKKRDGFNSMVERALNGEIDLILTKSISRFARNTVDTLQTVRQLKAAGVEVIFEKENIHTFDPKCEVLLTIMSSLAQEESRSISENVRWGKEKSMRDGLVYMPYGHFMGYRKGEDGRPEIVEEEAEIIRQIYRDFLSGKSISQIAKELTEKGIITPGGKKNWSISTVRSILSNEKYKGDAILQKTYTVDYLTKQTKKNEGEKAKYIVTDSHEPIIDPAAYDRAQRELSRRRTARPRKAGNDSPLANRLVCGDCGAFYGHKVWRSGGKNKNRYDVWYCNHRYSGEDKCQTPTLKEEDIWKTFAKLLKKMKLAHWTSDEGRNTIWRELFECATIYADGRIVFHTIVGKTITIANDRPTKLASHNFHPCTSS